MMVNEQIKNALRAKMPDFLRTECGIANLSVKFKCLNPEHDDRNPSMSYNADNYTVHCFSQCGSSFDIFDLIGFKENLSSFNEQLQKALELYPDIAALSADSRSAVNNKTKQSEKVCFRAYLDACNRNVQQTDYFKRRGLSDGVIERFRLGFDPKKGGVIIPRSDYAYTLRNINENCKDDDRYKKHGSNSHFFNVEALSTENSEPVIICEGEIDALSFIECGFNAVALGSVNNYKSFIKEVKKIKLEKLLIISLDNDPTGAETAEKLTNELKALSLKVVKIDLIPSVYKDANMFLLAEGKDKFCAEVGAGVDMAPAEEKALEEEEKALKEEEKEQYFKNIRVFDLAEEFENRVVLNKKAPAIHSCLKPLDDELGGGLFAGFYVFGACTGFGKTDLILQFAENIALSGRDVLMFALEMQKDELIARALSRNAYREANKEIDIFTKENKNIFNSFMLSSLLMGRIDDTKAEEYINRAKLNVFNTAGKHLFLLDRDQASTPEDVYAKVKEHIERTGNNPIVIVDFLQILAPDENSSKLSDKARTDLAVQTLRKIALDFYVPVIALSSLNRPAYNGPVGSDSFKESGSIEYTADVLLGMHSADAKEPDKNGKGGSNKPRKRNAEEEKTCTTYLKLKILKNRRGRKDVEIPLVYWPNLHVFFEGTSEENKEPIEYSAVQEVISATV